MSGAGEYIDQILRDLEDTQFSPKMVLLQSCLHMFSFRSFGLPVIVFLLHYRLS